MTKEKEVTETKLEMSFSLGNEIEQLSTYKLKLLPTSTNEKYPEFLFLYYVSVVLVFANVILY